MAGDWHGNGNHYRQALRPGGRLIIMNQGRGMAVLESDFEGESLRVIGLPWGHSTYHGYSSFDTEGNWYVTIEARNKPQQIWKFTPNGDRAKFGNNDAIVLGSGDDLFALTKGLCIGPNGDIYVVAQTDKWKMKPPAMTGGVKFGDLSARGEKACQTRVDVYGADGILNAVCFNCMLGTVSAAITGGIREHHDGIPITNLVYSAVEGSQRAMLEAFREFGGYE